MAIVIRNDSGHSLRLSGRGNLKEILPDQVMTLTDDEFEQIAFTKRGPGGIVAISPNEATSDSLRTKLDYYIDPGEPKLRYEGMALQGQLESDPVWIIRRFTWEAVVGTPELKITDIQILTNVKWTERTTLSWI